MMDSRVEKNNLRQNGAENNAPLEDYWQECSSFEEGAHEDEEDFSKTPDEGEAEEEWLREAGFQNLVDSDPNDPAQSEFFADILSTLTVRQIAVVKRRLDTVQMSKKKRVPRSSKHRADVRELFSGRDSASPPESLPTIPSEPSSLSFSVNSVNLSSSAPGGERWTYKSSTPSVRPNDEHFSFPQPQQPHTKSNSRALPLPFLRTSHSGGFSLSEHTRAIDCESPTSVEVLRYETRNSVINDKELPSSISDFSSMSSITSTDTYALETGFQEIASKINSLSDITVADEDLAPFVQHSNVQVGDLGENDRNLVRSLAIIEVAALLDTHGLIPTRRRKPNRKKGKENVVFGASINVLLELDRRRCTGLKIPLIFQWILHHLYSNGLREEGLLRLAGSAQKIQVLKAEIERNYITSPTLVENVIRQASPIDISVLLKQLVRHLPEPLLTNSHMDAFLQVPNIPNVSDQINILNLLILALPDGHRELLQELLYFLAKVVEDEDSNRMCLNNVAMIMAPNLFPPPRLKKGNIKNNDLATEVTVAAMSSKVTQLLIKYGHLLGAVPPELLAQARLQNRRTANKNAKRGGRKLKGDKHKNLKEDIPSLSVIRVQVPSLRQPSNLVFPICDRTTAGQIVQNVADVLEKRMDPRHQDLIVAGDQQENRAFLQRPRTTSEPIVIRQCCFLGTKKSDYLKNHFLYLIRENVGERRLNHETNIHTISGCSSGRFATGSTWEIRCFH